MLTLGSLFSGAGLLDLGLTRAGFRVIWHAETDKAASQVLARHWPDVPNLGDVTEVEWSTVPRPDVLTGGFPCPPFSSAGKRLGRDDPRYLWPVFARAIRVLRPRAVLLENVAALLTADGGSIFGEVIGDLAEAGYVGKWACVRASDVGAPHRRERVFLAAYADGFQPERRGGPGELGGSPTGEPRPGNQRERPGNTPGDGGQVASDTEGLGTSHITKEPDGESPVVSASTRAGGRTSCRDTPAGVRRPRPDSGMVRASPPDADGTGQQGGERTQPSGGGSRCPSCCVGRLLARNPTMGANHRRTSTRPSGRARTHER